MTHFHGLGHGNCVPRYAEGVPEIRKLDFRGFKGQFNVKKDNFKGLMAKIGHYRLILSSITHLLSIFMEYVMKNLI